MLQLVEYCVAVPPNRTVCAPAVSHVQVYVVGKATDDVRVKVLPESVLPYDDVF